MRRFLSEITRRNVHRAALAYLAGSWLLLQILETVLPIYDVDERVLRWSIGLLAIGFLPALAIAWVFEVSPGGFRLQVDLDREGESRTADAPRKMDRAIILVLALAVAFFATERLLLGPSASTSASVAVLPFADLTATGDQAYFGDGLAEELLNILARNPDLRVASRTSSFAFRNTEVPIDDIGQRLNVGHILEGSVSNAE